MSRFVFLIPDLKGGPAGGIMNIVRHAALARQLGGEAVLATDSGKDGHGTYWFHHGVPHIAWSDRRPEDVCVIPDIFTDRINAVQGPCVAYLQSPVWLRRNFDYHRDQVALWTDSPLMQEKCRDLYPGKAAPIVPNIVDDGAFPFVPQSMREPGHMIVFPRKGPEFIQAVFAEYRRVGGRYWKPRAVDSVPFDKLAQLFGRAQGFLASAEEEGCALPPQESMAAGVVVVGRDARGANFCMQHGKTAWVDSTVEGTVRGLVALEDPARRQTLATGAFEYIQRYFAPAEPTRFWKAILGGGTWSG